jgi:hypothetical protein
MRRAQALLAHPARQVHRSAAGAAARGAAQVCSHWAAAQVCSHWAAAQVCSHWAAAQVCSHWAAAQVCSHWAAGLEERRPDPHPAPARRGGPKRPGVVKAAGRRACRGSAHVDEPHNQLPLAAAAGVAAGCGAGGRGDGQLQHLLGGLAPLAQQALQRSPEVWGSARPQGSLTSKDAVQQQAGHLPTCSSSCADPRGSWEAPSQSSSCSLLLAR